MLLYWVWLSMRTAVTEREKWLLLQHFHDPEDLYFAKEEGLRELNMRPESLASLLDKDLSAAQKVIDDCVNKQIEICTMQDPQYPVRLKNIPDPPCVLYYMGDLGCMTESLCIAVVGTRKATPYGLKMARKIAFQMVSCGAVIVSGLAEGIDGAGATGGIMANGNVVGVLGCGLDRVYPAFHKNLYEQTRHSGCLISEFPPGTPPNKWNFPKRNRIIAGISCGNFNRLDQMTEFVHSRMDPAIRSNHTVAAEIKIVYLFAEITAVAKPLFTIKKSLIDPIPDKAALKSGQRVEQIPVITERTRTVAHGVSILTQNSRTHRRT